MRYYERLRELREDHDLSQQKVADMLSIGQRTYSDYESGKTRIPVESMLLLAKYYDVNMDYMTGISDIKKKYPSK